MAVTKQEAENNMNEELKEYADAIESYLDKLLLRGDRCFSTKILVSLTNGKISNYGIVDFLKKIYPPSSGWLIKRDTGDQRDWYDNVNFS